MSDAEANSKNAGFNPLYLIAIIALVAIGGGYYFMNINKSNAPINTEGSTTKENTQSPTQLTNETPMKTVTLPPTGNSTADTIATNVKTINMEAGAFYFKPNKITVKKGDTIKIVFKSVDMMHNFYLDEFNIKGPIVKGGNSDTFEFVANKVGSFEFYCNVGKHRAQGQVCTLIVE